MNFSLHITTSDYKGDYKNFNLERNFIQRFKDKAKRLKGKDLLAFADIIAKDIIHYARKRKWKTIPPAILTKLVNENESQVYVEENKKQLVWWLHKGTEAHFIGPKNKKALHWIVGGVSKWGAQFGGKDAFSKGHIVSGIIGMNFFRLSRESREKISFRINKKKNIF